MERKAVRGIMLTLLIISMLTFTFNIQPVKAEVGLAESPWPMFQHDPQRTGRSPYVGPKSREPEVYIFSAEGYYGFGPVAIGPNGTIYSRATTTRGTGLYAFNSDGTEKWFLNVSVGGYPTIGPDGTIYAKSVKGIIAVNSHGTAKWEKGIAIEYTRQQPVIGDEGILYFVAGVVLPNGSLAAPCLVALEANGKVVWLYDIRGNQTWYVGPDYDMAPGGSVGSTDTDEVTSPSIGSDGTIYFGSRNVLFAINADGTKKWQSEVAPEWAGWPFGPVIPSITSVICSNGVIYVAVNSVGWWADLWKCALCAINPDGNIVWKTTFEEGFSCPPVIGPDGTLYLFIERYSYFFYHALWYLIAVDMYGNGKWGVQAWEVWGLFSIISDSEGNIFVVSDYGRVRGFSSNGEQLWTLGVGGAGLALDQDGTLFVPGSKLYAIRDLRPENQPPTCVIKLQKDGVEISEIDVGEFFDIYVGNSTDDIGITQVRFSSDDYQDNYPTGEWTQWYDWGTSSGDWNASTKIKRWSFTTPGYKEVWAEVKDDINQTDKRLARIYVPGSQPPSCVVELRKDGVKIDDIDAGQFFDVYVGDSTDDAAIERVMFSSDDSQDGVPTGEWTDWYDWNQHSGDWSALDKTMKWSFATGGKKEVWALIEDSDGNVVWNHSNIFVHPGYAIIVAGQADWRLKSSIDHSANNAYRALRNLGFNDDHIFYLNSETPQDVDGDGDDEVDGFASFSHFENVMYDVKNKIGSRPTPFVLYLTGHGDVDANNYVCFIFGDYPPGEDVLWDFDLKRMLSEFLSETPMLIVLGLCYSGRFITCDKGISATNRIIVTATHDDQKRWSLLGVGGWERSSDRFWGNLNKGLNVKEAFTKDALIGDNLYMWLDDNGDRIGHSPNNLENDGELAARTYIGIPGTESLELTYWLLIGKHSPGELRVYDSQNRVTGLVNGQVKEEIQNSIYYEQDEVVVIFSPSDTYRYEVVGTDEGTYGLEVSFIEEGEAITFTATNIPTSANAVHQYTVDWDALSLGEEGVTVKVDSDGDGAFERTITADSVLTRDEFLRAGPPVGGVVIPVDKPALLAPWIFLTMLVTVAAMSVTIYSKKWSKKKFT